MQNNVLRKATAVAALIVLACCLTACGTIGFNDEEVIRKGLTEELELLKEPTRDSLEQYMGSADDAYLDQLQEYGIDQYEMIGILLDKFDYRIGNIALDDNKATALVSISNVDVPTAIQKVVSSMTDEEKSARMKELYDAGDEQAYMQQLFAYIYEGIEASKDIVTTDVQVALTKDGNEWKIDETSVNDLISALYGGMDMSAR